MGLLKNFIESERELNQMAREIKKEMKNEKIIEERKAFQEIFPVSDEEVQFFEYLYKKERRYRAAILILSLICLGLSLSIWM